MPDFLRVRKASAGFPKKCTSTLDNRLWALILKIQRSWLLIGAMADLFQVPAQQAGAAAVAEVLCSLLEEISLGEKPDSQVHLV